MFYMAANISSMVNVGWFFGMFPLIVSSGNIFITLFIQAFHLMTLPTGD